jgi:hypothetical protein
MPTYDDFSTSSFDYRSGDSVFTFCQDGAASYMSATVAPRTLERRARTCSMCERETTQPGAQQGGTNGAAAAPPTADDGSAAPHYRTISGTAGAALAGELQKMLLAKPGAPAAAAAVDKAVAAAAPAAAGGHEPGTEATVGAEKVAYPRTRVGGEGGGCITSKLPR